MKPHLPVEPDISQASLANLIERCKTFSETGNCTAGLETATLLARLAQSARDERAEAEATNHIAWFCLQLGLPDRGHEAAIRAKRVWTRLGDQSGLAVASAILGWLLVEMGLVDDSFEETTEGLKLAELQPDRQVLAFARNAKAVTYLYCRQDHLALPLLDQALEALGQDEVPALRALILVNIAYSQVSVAEAAEARGDMAEGQRWRQTAIAVNDQAIGVAETGGDLWNLRTALCNGAEYYAQQNEIAVAEDYLERWLGLSGDVGLRSEIHYLYTRGELLTKTGRTEEALEICRKAAALADTHNQADHKANTSKRLAEALEAMGDYRGALAHYKRFHAAFEAQMGETTRRRAQQVESTLENEKLRIEAMALRFQADHDALTGLPNRRSFEAALAASEGTQFCLGILDLDHFKAVNDNHSHVVGDIALKCLAGILTRFQTVAAFRLGGEEFALLFAGQSLEEALAQAEATRLAIADYDWDGVSAGLQLTASIGLASSAETRLPGIVELADRRLYGAKAAGRNRVVAE